MRNWKTDGIGRGLRLVLPIVALLIWSSTHVLWAQTGQPPAADGFVPMSEISNREVLPATPLVFYAYAFVWLALLGYVFILWRKLGRVEADLEAIRRRLTQQGGGR